MYYIDQPLLAWITTRIEWLINIRCLVIDLIYHKLAPLFNYIFFPTMYGVRTENLYLLNRQLYGSTKSAAGFVDSEVVSTDLTEEDR